MSDQVADRSGGRCPFLEIRLAGTTCHCPSARSLDRPGPPGSLSSSAGRNRSVSPWLRRP